MNRTNLIVTHAAVFSVGIAAALVFNGIHEPQAPSAEPGNARSPRTASSNASGSSFGDGPSRMTRPGSETARETSKRESKPAAERLAGIVRITDPFQRQRALMDMIDTLAPAEFAEVAEQYRQLDHFSDSRGEYDLLLRGWAKADPLGALDYIGKNGNSRRASSTVLSAWAGNDPAAAERWAIDHFKGEGPNPYMSSVIRGIAANDVSHATALALGMPSGEERGDA